MDGAVSFHRLPACRRYDEHYSDIYGRILTAYADKGYGAVPDCNNKYPGLYSVTKTLQITTDTNTQQATIDDVVSKSDSRINAIGIASENSKTTLIAIAFIS